MHALGQIMLKAMVRMTGNSKQWERGQLTMPEPFLAFSNSWKKFSNSLPSIYPFPAKIAKKKKKAINLNSKIYSGWGGEVGGFMENLFSSLVIKQVSGPTLDC